MPIIGKDDFDEDSFFDVPTPPLMTINMKPSRPEGDPLVPVARSLMKAVGVLARTDYSLAEFIMNSLKNEGIPIGMLKYVSNEQIVRAITNEVERVEEVKAGDKVIYSKYSGTEVKLDDEEYIIVKQNDILAVVE